ncbi:hypothetical protein MVEN_02316400 [Mycena venus]|uniref:Uncharacterized protein n=1 Tax=Mycena venus TaxID=2733690 RepID=A0A8H7CF37_9AGAR|nr:hypothetical protein MVEN_02316400 [Mycena venus]
MQTVSRIRERRSLVGTVALRVVEEFFGADEYKDKPIAIRQYARYAVRPDGPGFWRIPTPENIPSNPKHPNYIKGVDYLESPFIIKTATAFLKNQKYIIPEAGPDGKFDFSGLPSGLFALSAAGVERAFNAFTATGVRPQKLPKFSQAESGTTCSGYANNIRRFTRSRWESLLNACGVEAEEAAIAPADAMAVDGIRDSMYIPSSP